MYELEQNSFHVSWTLQLRSLQIEIGFASPPSPRNPDSADATLNPHASRKLPGNQLCQADLSIYLGFFLVFFIFPFHCVILPNSSGSFTSAQSLAEQKRPVERFNEASFLG